MKIDYQAIATRVAEIMRDDEWMEIYRDGAWTKSGDYSTPCPDGWPAGLTPEVAIAAELAAEAERAAASATPDDEIDLAAGPAPLMSEYRQAVAAEVARLAAEQTS